MKPYRALLLLFALLAGSLEAERSLLNVSYDATREFYGAYNELFVSHWKTLTGEGVSIHQSHGGSGAQARAVISGLPADVVSLALAYDIDSIARSGLLPEDWQSKLPDHSSPYTSTIVFLTRKGNPKGIKDWDDLARPGVTALAPNPKTGGAPRWIYLAAWGYALKAKHEDDAGAQRFVAALYKNIPVLDSGSRGSSTSFVERGLGDVLITWESEALLIQSKAAPGDYELVVPSLSILAEPSVAVVEKNAFRNGNLDLARAYLRYLYSPEAQELEAKYFFRPQDPKALESFPGRFQPLRLFRLDSVFGSWAAAQKRHFDDGGSFDQIYLK